MIFVSMRIDPGDSDTNAAQIERRLREYARDESWKVDALQVWHPSDDRTIASLKAALDIGLLATARQSNAAPPGVELAGCPLCGREVRIRDGRLARHYNRPLKRLCLGSGRPVPRR